MYVVLQCDFLVGVTKLKFKQQVIAGGASTSANGPDEKALRDVLANAYSIGIAAVMFNDKSNKMKLGIFIVTGRRTKAWQGKSNAFLRGVDRTAEWLKRQIAGDFFRTMTSIVGELSNEASLEEISFTIGRTSARAAEHDEVVWEDSFAKLFFK